MAIDFPTSPSHGQTYDFNFVRYTFTTAAGLPGYWTISEPGLGGAASSAEIDSGTDAFKFATPLGLQGSKYLDQQKISVNAGTVGSVVKGQALNFNPGNGITLGRAGNDIAIGAKTASDTVAGVMKVHNSVTSIETADAASAYATKVAYDEAISSEYSETLEASIGWHRQGDNKAELVASNGLLYCWGSVNIGYQYVGYEQVVVFPRRFAIAPWSIQVTCSSNVGGLYGINGSSTTGFTLRSLSAQAVTAMWFAVGRDAVQ